MEDLGSSSTQRLMNKIWKQVIPPKIKLFAWSLVKEKLQTRKRLSKFITTLDSKCPLCNSHKEDQNHLFLHSSYTKQVRNCSNDALLLNIDSNLTVSEWLCGLPHNDKRIISSLSKFLAICWQIGNDRNASIFKNEKPFHYRSFTHAMNMVNDYFKENSGYAKKADAVVEDNLIKWQCPISPYFKINFDGSIANSVSTGGFVVRS